MSSNACFGLNRDVEIWIICVSTPQGVKEARLRVWVCVFVCLSVCLCMFHSIPTLLFKIICWPFRLDHSQWCQTQSLYHNVYDKHFTKRVCKPHYTEQQHVRIIFKIIWKFCHFSVLFVVVFYFIIQWASYGTPHTSTQYTYTHLHVETASHQIDHIKWLRQPNVEWRILYKIYFNLQQ